jgi:hypothetical protein
MLPQHMFDGLASIIDFVMTQAVTSWAGPESGDLAAGSSSVGAEFDVVEQNAKHVVLYGDSGGLSGVAASDA